MAGRPLRNPQFVLLEDSPESDICQGFRLVLKKQLRELGFQMLIDGAPLKFKTCIESLLLKSVAEGT